MADVTNDTPWYGPVAQDDPPLCDGNPGPSHEWHIAGDDDGDLFYHGDGEGG